MKILDVDESQSQRVSKSTSLKVNESQSQRVEGLRVLKLTSKVQRPEGTAYFSPRHRLGDTHPIILAP